MNPSTTALILIGYQKDYFHENGILHKVIEAAVAHVLSNTLDLLDHLAPSPATIVSTPINFTPDYTELVDPIGILKIIRDVGAFKQGTTGADAIDELARYGDRIIEIPGKRGLNAFHATHLKAELEHRGITDVVLAGVVTSICIDSTARSAFEYGFQVSVLSDCTAGRSGYEQDFYCNEVLPLYAKVMTHTELLEKLQLA
ncbi:MAG: cysteine hydrolase family protein [Gammaproteobacteria bacterium]|nr:cysteine hydrolase family protein [Gammaproteobacteria bacterium]MBU1653842.1 cysteine hydrolase family protein [Gammaproteobacteria bacterium]MBU1961637.1 cysteine hydrolase family protein [Gammaproteobacteria bacterium]